MLLAESGVGNGLLAGKLGTAFEPSCWFLVLLRPPFSCSILLNQLFFYVVLFLVRSLVTYYSAVSIPIPPVLIVSMLYLVTSSIWEINFLRSHITIIIIGNVFAVVLGRHDCLAASGIHHHTVRNVSNYSIIQPVNFTIKNMSRFGTSNCPFLR